VAVGGPIDLLLTENRGGLLNALGKVGLMDVVGCQNILEPGLFRKSTVRKRVRHPAPVPRPPPRLGRRHASKRGVVPVRHVGDKHDLLTDALSVPRDGCQFGACNLRPGRLVGDTAR
jgi:hypothetical protein